MSPATRLVSRRANLLFGSALAVVGACDESAPPRWSAPTTSDGGLDGSAGLDGSSGADASVPGCRVEVLDLLDDADSSEISFDVAGGTSAFEVLYTARRSSADPTRNAFALRVPFAGAAAAPVPALAAGDEELLGQPVVRASGDGFLAAWSQTFGQAYELATARIDASGALASAVRNASSTPTAAEVHPALLERDSGGFLGAYVVQTLSMSTVVDTPTFATFDGDGVPTSAPTPIVGSSDVHGTLRLHTLGAGPTLGWRDASSVFRLASLGSDGTLGTVRAVSGAAAVAEDFDFVGDVDGGVAVYDVALSPARTVPKLRVLAADGALVGDARELVTGARRGGAPALVAGPEGYVVAYRGSDDGTTWALRLAFVDRSSYAVVEDRAVASLVEAAGRVRITSEPGGRLLVVFHDGRDGAAGERLRAARIDCR